MKINSTAAFQAYNKVAKRGSTVSRSRQDPQAAEEPAQKLENTDRLLISPEAARQREVEQLASSIMSQIKEPASPQRLDNLRAAVQNKTYSVPTGDLVDAMMERWFTA